jgi:hypothetical protein
MNEITLESKKMGCRSPSVRNGNGPATEIAPVASRRFDKNAEVASPDGIMKTN